MVTTQSWNNRDNGVTIRIDYQARCVSVFAPHRRKPISRGPLLANADDVPALLTQQGYRLTNETRACPGLTMADVIGS